MMADLFGLAADCRFAAAANRPDQMRATLGHVSAELYRLAGPPPAAAARPLPNSVADFYPSAVDIPRPPRRPIVAFVDVPKPCPAGTLRNKGWLLAASIFAVTCSAIYVAFRLTH